MYKFKKCSTCNLRLPKTIEFFYKRNISENKFRSRCKICCYKARIINLKKMKIRERKANLKKQHNMTLDDYNNLYKLQKRKCAICNKCLKNNGVRQHIDHDHKTNKIRGLLCSNCNLGLGHFKDKIKFLKRAIKYLERL